MSGMRNFGGGVLAEQGQEQVALVASTLISFQHVLHFPGTTCRQPS